MVDFSVAICTYNGEKRLPDVLDRLKVQVGTDLITWEIIIIDNNSTDDTAKVIAEYQADWDEICPLKYYFQPQQGLAFARQQAVKEAQGTLIGFLDDDNLPDPDWVAAAYAFGQKHPQAGAFNGKIHGDFEVEPPPNFKNIAPFLAIGGGKKAICYTSDPQYAPKRALPAGAGIVIRRQAWLESVPERLFFQGRVGGSMVGGEDIETLLHIKKAGWEIWYNPEMVISHKIPKNRLEREYLLKLLYGVGLTRCYTRLVEFKAWQKGFIILAFMANDLRKLAVHLVKNYRVIESDTVAACQMNLLIGSIVSPFYLAKISNTNREEESKV